MEHFLGVGEHTRVPRERSIRGVPTGRTETGAQINQRVAGQPPLTECLCLGEYFLAASECAMRLLVAESPERWHLGVTGYTRVRGHDDAGCARRHRETIKTPRRAPP